MDELRGLVDRVTILTITHRRSVIRAQNKIVALAGGSAPTSKGKNDENAHIGQDGV